MQRLPVMPVMAEYPMLDFPLMLQVKLPVVDRIHPKSNKFAMGVETRLLMTQNLMTALNWWNERKGKTQIWKLNDVYCPKWKTIDWFRWKDYIKCNQGLKLLLINIKVQLGSYNVGLKLARATRHSQTHYTFSVFVLRASLPNWI